PVGQLNIGIMAGIYDPQTAVLVTSLLGLTTVVGSALVFPILRKPDSMRIDSRLRALNSADLRRVPDAPGAD
ncbi:MAG: hypothetical protein HOE75_14480, partial [Chloroflexi bacterium]|nr:hypothetical protein [Chloroflexota bacterium]